MQRVFRVTTGGLFLRRFYTPSGRISKLFLLYLLLTLFLFTPLISFLHGAVIYYSPNVMLSLASTVISIFTIALLCGHWCITKARVRSKGIAGFTSLLMILLFCAGSVAAYCVCYENAWNLTSIASLLKPSRLFSAIGSVTRYGIGLSRRQASFLISGPPLVVLVALHALVALIVVTVHFRILAGKPFDERRNRWVQGISLNFPYIEEPDAFIDKLLFRDSAYLNRLDVLREVNISYSTFELFPMDDRYFLSIENYRENGKNKYGNTQFKREQLTEYLIIEKQIGDILLSKQVRADPQGVKAKIVDRRGKQNDAFALLCNAVITGVFLFSAYMAYRNGQADASILSGPTPILAAAAFVLYNALSMVGSYTKEDVIILAENGLEEDWRPPDAETSVYHVEQRDSGLAYKLFYTLMMCLSAGALVYIVILNLR